MSDRLITLLELIALGLFILILVSVYVIRPLRVWHFQSFDPSGQLEKIEPEHLPPAVDRYFLQLTPSIAAQGFVVVAYLRRPVAAGMSSYLAQWVNRRSGQSATVLAVSGNAGLALRMCAMHFKTRLPDGTTVETDNGSNADLLVLERNYHRLQFPDVDDPATLYQLHLWHEEQRLDPKEPRFLRADEQLIDHMTREVKRIFSRQVAEGRMKEGNGRYHHTLFNAYRSVWKQLPPLRQIRRTWKTRVASRMKQQALAGAPRRSPAVVTTDVLLMQNNLELPVARK